MFLNVTHNAFLFLIYFYLENICYNYFTFTHRRGKVLSTDMPVYLSACISEKLHGQASNYMWMLPGPMA